MSGWSIHKEEGKLGLSFDDDGWYDDKADWFILVINKAPGKRKEGKKTKFEFNMFSIQLTDGFVITYMYTYVR